MASVCALPGCEKPGKGRLCSMHAARRQKYGSPDDSALTQPLHGYSRHPLYDTHRDMVARCHNPTWINYKNYGGRGIAVCEQWRTDVGAFIRWIEANLGTRPDGHSLDRIDGSRGYEPGNLRWATRVEQRANRREG